MEKEFFAGSIMREIELKYDLRDREEYERVLRALGEPARVLRQVNHYFIGDGGNRLRRGEAVLRLREEDGRFTLAFKTGAGLEGGVLRCEETEAPLDAETARALLDSRRNPLALDHEASKAAAGCLGGGDLRIAGSSRTERAEFRMDEGEVLQVDRVEFPGGGEDFEIEMETDDPRAADFTLRRMFGQMGIVLAPQKKTKVRRFLEAAGLWTPSAS